MVTGRPDLAIDTMSRRLLIGLSERTSSMIGADISKVSGWKSLIGS